MNFKTDMADERRDLYKNANNLEDEIAGIECESQDCVDGIHLTLVRILDEKGEECLQKKKGNYITIDLKRVNNISDELKDKIIDIISEELHVLVCDKIN